MNEVTERCPKCDSPMKGVCYNCRANEAKAQQQAQWECSNLKRASPPEETSIEVVGGPIGGIHQTFDTGAQRGLDTERSCLALIPIEALEAYGRAFAEGEAKYGRDNWLKGFPQTNLLEHAARHIYRYLRGDVSEDHLGHAMWNIGTAIFQHVNRPDLDDRPKYKQRES